jgi:hypothetical protein
MRLAFLKCAGNLPEKELSRIDELDTEYHRRDKVSAALQVNLERITDDKVKALVSAILFGSDDKVNKALEPYIQAS